MKTRRLMQNDANIQTLMRIYVHHAGSQIHSEYSESIAHMCFANCIKCTKLDEYSSEVLKNVFMK